MRSPPSPEVTSRARSVWSTGRRRPTSADAGPHERLDDGGVAAGVVVEVGRNQRAAGEAVAPLPEAASQRQGPAAGVAGGVVELDRSDEHTSELQSLMRISYDVFCLKKTKRISE